MPSRPHYKQCAKLDVNTPRISVEDTYDPIINKFPSVYNKPKDEGDAINRKDCQHTKLVRCQ